MDPVAFARIARRIADASLGGLTEGEILADFCTALNEADVPVQRAVLGADTLHPVLAGRIFGWKQGEDGIILHEFGRSTTEEGERKWRESPFHHLEQSGASQLRVRIAGHNGDFPFPIVTDLAAEGYTDFLVTMTRFGDKAIIGQLDSIFASWSTGSEGG
jgi:adenylate cyclase